MKKTTSLKGLFRRFTAALGLCLAAAVAVPLLLMNLAVSAGVAVRADQSERQAKELVPILSAAPDLSQVSFPPGCSYLILDRAFQELSGNMSGADGQDAVRYARGELVQTGERRQFLLIVRENELCVLRYYVGARFTVPWLPDGFPSTDAAALFLICLNALLAVVLLSARFAKTVRAQLAPLLDATAQISRQNLDFETGHSAVKELEEVLASFSGMKESLKNSLEQEWRSAQAQREQLAALTHDLKTPMTVVCGNAELLSDAESKAERERYTGFILEGCRQMQRYMQRLIDVTKAHGDQPLNRQELLLSSLLEELEKQNEGLCALDEIRLQVKGPGELRFSADRELLLRALSNVVSNAVEHSPRGGSVSVEAGGDGKLLSFVVTDEGPGFSAQALQRAADRFFMDDGSRSSKAHYGIGLAVAASVASRHGGRLFWENDAKTHGARVTLQIPYGPVHS